AACIVVAAARGHLAKVDVAKEVARQAATTIQAAARGHLAKKETVRRQTADAAAQATVTTSEIGTGQDPERNRHTVLNTEEVEHTDPLAQIIQKLLPNSTKETDESDQKQTGVVLSPIETVGMQASLQEKFDKISKDQGPLITDVSRSTSLDQIFDGQKTIRERVILFKQSIAELAEACFKHIETEDNELGDYCKETLEKLAVFDHDLNEAIVKRYRIDAQTGDSLTNKNSVLVTTLNYEANCAGTLAGLTEYLPNSRASKEGDRVELDKSEIQGEEALQATYGEVVNSQGVGAIVLTTHGGDDSVPVVPRNVATPPDTFAARWPWLTGVLGVPPFDHDPPKVDRRFGFLTLPVDEADKTHVSSDGNPNGEHFDISKLPEGVTAELLSSKETPDQEIQARASLEEIIDQAREALLRETTEKRKALGVAFEKLANKVENLLSIGHKFVPDEGLGNPFSFLDSITDSLFPQTEVKARELGINTVSNTTSLDDKIKELDEMIKGFTENPKDSISLPKHNASIIALAQLSVFIGNYLANSKLLSQDTSYPILQGMFFSPNTEKVKIKKACDEVQNAIIETANALSANTVSNGEPKITLQEAIDRINLEGLDDDEVDSETGEVLPPDLDQEGEPHDLFELEKGYSAKQEHHGGYEKTEYEETKHGETDPKAAARKALAMGKTGPVQVTTTKKASKPPTLDPIPEGSEEEEGDISEGKIPNLTPSGNHQKTPPPPTSFEPTTWLNEHPPGKTSQIEDEEALRDAQAEELAKAAIKSAQRDLMEEEHISEGETPNLAPSGNHEKAPPPLTSFAPTTELNGSPSGEASQIENRNNAAATIQRAVRGHQARAKEEARQVGMVNTAADAADTAKYAAEAEEEKSNKTWRGLAGRMAWGVITSPVAAARLGFRLHNAYYDGLLERGN
ncbi:MAG: hypothetical protein AAF621_04900, partial [Pseudomonadota bacterium]